MSSGARRWLAVNRRRIFEVVGVDVVAWDATRKVPSPRLRDDVSVERLEDVALLSPKQQAQVRSFLARGDEGYVAVRDGRLAGWVWLSRTTHRDPWSGLWIRLAPDEAYSYALWVEPESRPSGAAAGLMAAMLRDVQRDADVTRVYGWIDEGNRASQTLLRVVFGFAQVQRVRRVHVLRRIGFKLPRSDDPPFGPLSASGRHSSREGGAAARTAAPL
jgi:GNAT superfamily N-acetyltransferase